ncbi:MAG TPA: SOS response-associated peptidase [Candidatus Omnitrophota bacterium]|nr:SOS response-associated peptidase [Candidatus Omnitrophota bacterium]
MCSRYELNASAREVAGRFQLRVPPPLPNRAEVRPTDPALVVLPGGESRLLRWGLDVSWDKRPLINARAETLASRSAFKRLLGSRILIPATLWWEWRKNADGSKTKMRIRRPDGDLFAFAGLVDGERFTMVTCAPAPSVAHVHDRMPSVLSPAAEADWLDPAVPFADVAANLEPYREALDVAVDEDKPAQGSLF